MPQFVIGTANRPTNLLPKTESASEVNMDDELEVERLFGREGGKGARGCRGTCRGQEEGREKGSVCIHPSSELAKNR